MDFTNGFKCSDAPKFDQRKNLSINIFELIFYQDQNKWRHKLIPMEVSKNESDRVVDLIIYKNHYALIKILNVFSGDHSKKYLSRRCFSSYTSENMLMLHKQKCTVDNRTTLRTSFESHIYWKKQFHKNPLNFRVYAYFEADNEIDIFSTKKTTNIYKPNPVLNGYHKESELQDVLKSGYHKPPLGFNNVDWFVNEVIKIENKKTFYFENTKKDIIMTEKERKMKKILKIISFVVIQRNFI